jgi:death-on-curing protein
MVIVIYPLFLSIEDVLELHKELIDRNGGSHGVRDEGLLESAIQQPEASFDGTYLHSDLAAMAAAYLFHLVENHPFVDGNKRIGFAACAAFLAINNTSISADLDLEDGDGKTAVEKVVIDITLKKLSKEQLTEVVRSWIK